MRIRPVPGRCDLDHAPETGGSPTGTDQPEGGRRWSHAQYGTGADIVADWDKAANPSSEDPVTKVLSPDIDRTVLEVMTTSDVPKGAFEFSGGSGPRTITNAQLVEALGSETDFKLRA